MAETKIEWDCRARMWVDVPVDYDVWAEVRDVIFSKKDVFESMGCTLRKAPSSTLYRVELHASAPTREETMRILNTANRKVQELAKMYAPWFEEFKELENGASDELPL